MEPAPRAGRLSDAASAPSLREQWEGASLAARALLPVRFFFGFTFLYAGVDKLLDPAFFNAAAPTSIASQLAAFARTSPMAFAIRPIEPFATPLGLLIALGEIAIGIGALSGLAFRLAAAGGTLLSFLFFLTASWSTHPYYFGADLPYAFGWLALVIAGTSDLLVPAFVRDLSDAMGSSVPWGQRVDAALSGGGFRPPRYLDEAPSASRRYVVQTGLVGAATLVVAALALPVRVLRGGDDAGSAGVGVADASTGPDTSGPSPDPSSSAGVSTTPVPGGPTSAPHATAAPGVALGGLTVATTAQVDAHGAVRIRVPTSAPSSLPAGDPAMIVKLKSGGYACFDTVCTHEGCRVGWDAQDGVMLCPCHGAAFDPNNHAAVLQGPTNQPLLELPLTIDAKTGAITLKA